MVDKIISTNIDTTQILDTNAVKYLSSGMKDRSATQIVMALQIMQSNTGLPLFNDFELFCKDMLKQDS